MKTAKGIIWAVNMIVVFNNNYVTVYLSYIVGMS